MHKAWDVEAYQFILVGEIGLISQLMNIAYFNLWEADFVLLILDKFCQVDNELIKFLAWLGI